MKHFLLLLTLLISYQLSAQVGAGNMVRMNSLLQQYGDHNNPIIQYDAQFGMAEQRISKYTDRYTISNIEKIVVKKMAAGYTTKLECEPENNCISHIDPDFNSTYTNSVLYIFNNEEAANLFARLAGEIIRTDFKKKVEVEYTKEPNQKLIEKQTSGEIADVPDTKKPKLEKPPKEKDDFLNISDYTDNGNADADQSLSDFGKKLMALVDLAEANELNKIKGAASQGAYATSIKLPKAKRNYINTYKGEDCFIAEFDTKKQHEDLLDLYDELQSEIEQVLPIAYEPHDMAFEEIYDNSDDEVFHTEYYNREDAKKTSIVIRITPDGKMNTLFLRIGKK